jgi:hypothetical protein
MAISAVRIDERVAGVQVTDSHVEVTLSDGRHVSAPLGWFPKIAAASPAARAKWEISAAGFGIHWPDLDEDIGVAGLLRKGAAEL